MLIPAGNAAGNVAGVVFESLVPQGFAGTVPFAREDTLRRPTHILNTIIMVYKAYICS